MFSRPEVCLQVIYVVEDDKSIRELVAYAMDSAGFETVCCNSAAEFFSRLDPSKAQLAILDIMLPGENGLEILSHLRSRAETAQIPVMIMSALGEEMDKVRGLDLGADDYIAKPFNPMEVVARVKAQLRRAGRGGDLLTVGDLTLDVARCELRRGGEPISLTPTEYKILALLMRSPGRIFTKAQLYEGVAGEYFESSDNTMMVHISKLREKLEEDPRNPRHIITIRGLGYKIEA